MFKGLSIFFILFSIVVIIIVFYYLKRIKNNEKTLQFSVGLLLGGTVGNLIDRLFYGAVVDFIDFGFFPVFNMADISNSLAAFLILMSLIKK